MTGGGAERPFLDRLGARLDQWPSGLLRIAALLSIPALGFVDYASGPDVAFSVFYLIPLAILGSRPDDDRSVAVVGSVLAALTWLLADIAAGADYTNEWIPVWNTGTRLVMFLVVVSLLANLRRAVGREQSMARLDPLTSVPNGRAFNEILEVEKRRAHRHGRALTLCYLDIDNFKGINDAHGHRGGDEALRRVAAALTQSVREVDTVGRLGGDEFGILLPETAGEGAEVVVRALPERVRGALRDVGFPITFSLGSITFQEIPDTDTMISEADALMYEVKRTGKNSVKHRVATRSENVPAS
ncbi:MAG TPA: GGDEF domain-containing protein [Actinomycetota bacterium]|nr:GGDEF domain-containing protein [Actinomycetota bacterium]